MKRIIYSLIVVLIISLTIGCGSKKEVIKKAENKKEVDYKSIYMEVLEGKRNFINEDDKEITFNDYLNTEKGNMDSAKVTYTYIDFDNKDSIKHEEMLVLTETNDGYFLILNYDEYADKVYGIYKNYRDMIYVKSDGSIYGSGGANASYVYKLILDKNKYEEVVLAENNEGMYKIDNKEVTKDEYDNYLEEFNKKDSISYTDYKNIELNSDNTSSTNNVSVDNKENSISGTYYLELTDGTIVTDGSGTIILNSDNTCSYYSGWSDMVCTSYTVSNNNVCLNLQETGGNKCFTLNGNILSDTYENYIKNGD